MNIVSIVELANHISKSLDAHYRDIGDIDFMIDELIKKRKGIARRMKNDAVQLRSLMNDSTFVSSVNDETMTSFKDALSGVDELVESINGNTITRRPMDGKHEKA